MITFEELWPKLRNGKRYREEFVAQHAKQGLGFQIQALLQQFGWSQNELAKRSGVSQGAISRAIDPSYGGLTVNTCVRIAAGFDVAFVGCFVPFSELPKWLDRLYAEPFSVADFDQDDAIVVSERAATTELTTTTTNSQLVAPFFGALPDNVVRMFGHRKGPKPSQTRRSRFQPSEEHANG